MDGKRQVVFRGMNNLNPLSCNNVITRRNRFEIREILRYFKMFLPIIFYLSEQRNFSIENAPLNVFER